jgi:hypothetical protein
MVPLVRGGTVQTYRLRWPESPAAEEIEQLGVWFFSAAGNGPGSVDLLSVRVAPIDEAFRDPSVGIRHIVDPGRSRRTLFSNAPSRVEYRVSVPERGRLDYGASALRADAPVTFRVRVEPPRGEARTLAEEVASGTTPATEDFINGGGALETVD